MQFHEDHPSDQ
ncbi:hypothetical protein D043_4014A, partial [Vibrio parahaemolyticus EKP-021]